MANKTPIVLNSGELSQLQVGDVLVDPNTQAPYNNLVVCKAVVAFSKGDIGHMNGFLTVIPLIDKPIADGSMPLIYPFCFAPQAIAANAQAPVQFVGGYLTGLSGLSPEVPYYLSATTAGALTDTPPSGSGKYVVRVGYAVTATIMFFKFERPILLR